MTIEAIVARESTNPGYYRVIPTIGGGVVEAIDIHRIGFVPGEKVTIIQIGDQYGIAKKLAMLPSVLSVPDNAKMALATENPAQFFCAYLGTQLGRLQRIYVLADVVSVSATVVIATISSGIDSGKTVSASPIAGMIASDFLVGDKIPLKISNGAYYACGWWGASAAILGLRIFNINFEAHQFIIPHRRLDQSLCTLEDIEAADNPFGDVAIGYEKTEVGTYDVEGTAGEVGAFYPFSDITDSGGPLAPSIVYYGFDSSEAVTVSLIDKKIRFGNDIKITYQLPGTGMLKARLSGLDKIQVTDSANYSENGLLAEITTLKINTDGSVRIVFITARLDLSSAHTADILNNPENYYYCAMGDFHGVAPFVVTMPPGTVEFLEEPTEITRGSGGCVGEIDLKTGAFEIESSEGNWRICGNRDTITKNATIILELDGEIVGSSTAGEIDIETVYVHFMGEVAALNANFFAKKYTPEAA